MTKMLHIIDGQLQRTIELVPYLGKEVTVTYSGGGSMKLEVARLSEFMVAWLNEGGVLVAANDNEN